MTQKQKAIRTTMYSVETIGQDGAERQEVVTHHLPWEKGSEKIQALVRRGYTFEHPFMGAVSVPQGRTFDGVVAVVATQDKRVAALKLARKAKAAKKKSG